MSDDLRCHVCHGALSVVEEFSSLNQVTSDCRGWDRGGLLAVCRSCGVIQKPVTEGWLRQVAGIYKDYEIYAQGGGAEATIFEHSADSGNTRSEKILRWLARHSSPPTAGSLLDAGCGSGSFLRVFGAHYPDWTLAGLEYDDKNNTALEAIPGVTAVHVGDPAELRERFDLIVMIHSLEHIPDSANYLRKLGNLLRPGGLIFVDVPDLQNTPFDILVADHCSHFTWPSLNRVLDAAGLDTVAGQQDAIPKEMFSLTRPRAADSDYTRSFPSLPRSSFSLETELARAHCAWLGKIVQHSESIAGNVGMFGSSISATWLATSLAGKVTCFVDEDRNRAGREHLGLPIYDVAEAPRDAPILMPLRRDIAKSISARLSREGLNFVLPPEA